MFTQLNLPPFYYTYSTNTRNVGKGQNFDYMIVAPPNFLFVCFLPRNGTEFLSEYGRKVILIYFSSLKSAATCDQQDPFNFSIQVGLK